MKAVAVFPGSQQVKIIEQDIPRLTQPDQVALRLLDVGICGTGKEICSFEYGTPPPGDGPGRLQRQRRRLVVSQS